MDTWLPRALEQRYVTELTPEKLQHGVLSAAVENPWYDDGVVFDWSSLHGRLATTKADAPPPLPPQSGVPSSASANPRGGLSLAQETEALFSFVPPRQAESDDFTMITVIEVSHPWELQPLSEQAQSWSVFSVRDTSAPLVDGLTAQRVFTFLRGPPGQRSVRQDITRVLQNVTSQLRASKLHVQSFLSSFVLLNNDFTTLLHETAAVHKALKQAGLELNIAASSLGPRRIFPLDERWCALPLESLSSDADIALFTTDLFFQWLQDSYVWRCLPPIMVFADTTTATTTSGPTSGEAQLNARRVRLFERFVRRLLLPQAARIGFQGLKDTLPEEGGDLLELSETHLKRKRTLVGPQKWTILDLRLTLCHAGAYEIDPLVFFSDNS